MNGTVELDSVLKMATADCVMREDCSTVADVLPRKRADKGYAELVESIKEQGIRDPVLICEGFLVGNGLHRIAAAQDLGYERIKYTDDPSLGFSDDKD